MWKAVFLLVVSLFAYTYGGKTCAEHIANCRKEYLSMISMDNLEHFEECIMEDQGMMRTCQGEGFCVRASLYSAAKTLCGLLKWSAVDDCKNCQSNCARGLDSCKANYMGSSGHGMEEQHLGTYGTCVGNVMCYTDEGKAFKTNYTDAIHAFKDMLATARDEHQHNCYAGLEECHHKAKGDVHDMETVMECMHCMKEVYCPGADAIQKKRSILMQLYNMRMEYRRQDRGYNHGFAAQPTLMVLLLSIVSFLFFK